MHNSNHLTDDYQDQRANGGMEDSSLTTIDYLRARLLSERSVSKAAKERADELAKRVADLEDQLKIANLQRKKAEKVTMEVLAFLENHRVSDVSETLESEYEEEESLCDSRTGKSDSIMEECLGDLNLTGDDKEGAEGFEQEPSPSSGRSLSWKIRKDTHRTREKKCSVSSIHKWTSLSHGDSSPRHHLGRSCRQIKRKEIRSVIEDTRHETKNPDSHGGDGINHSAPPENSLNTETEELKNCSEMRDQRSLGDGQFSGSLGTQRSENENNEEMERALEHQAHLIGHFEAQEKAQREWEDKYRENNSSTPDSFEHGNHSDVTEERDETRDAVAQPAEILSCHNSDKTSQEVSNRVSNESSMVTQFNSFKLKPHADPECSQGQTLGEMHALKSSPDFAFPVVFNNQSQQHLENRTCYSPPQASIHLHPLHSGGGAMTSSQPGSGNSRSEVSVENSDQEYALMPHAGTRSVEGILDVLHQAKSLLTRRINSSVPRESGSVSRTIDQSVYTSRDLDRVKIPVSCAGLFRVPFHLQSEGPTEARKLISDWTPSLSNYNHYSNVPLAAQDYYQAGPMKPRLSSTPVGRFSNSPANGTEYGVPYGKQWIDLPSDSSMQSSGEFSRSPYPDSRPQVPGNGVYSGQFSGVPAARPPLDGPSYYNHLHDRPNMYRN